MTISLVSEDGRRGISVVARDVGPGIANPEEAMQDGYSTYHGLGPRTARREAPDGPVRPGVGPRRGDHRDDGEVVAVTGSTDHEQRRERRRHDRSLQHRDQCRARRTDDDKRCSPSWSPTCGATAPTLRQQWAERITQAHLLSSMTDQEVFSEATSVYDNYVEVLETGSVEALQHYARDLSERIIPRGVETHEVIGIVLLLRDVLARSLFEKYREDFELLNQVLDAYEPAANRIANTVAVSFVEQRERVIRDQQDALLELSTPVLQVRERLLILPIIGVLDADRAQQLTEQLLHGIRAHRAKLVVIDITGVPTWTRPWPTRSSTPSRPLGSWART